MPPGGIGHADVYLHLARARPGPVCEANEKAIAGGGASAVAGDWDLVESHPLLDTRFTPPLDSWHATFRNATSRPLSPHFQGNASCVS